MPKGLDLDVLSATCPYGCSAKVQFPNRDRCKELLDDVAPEAIFFVYTNNLVGYAIKNTLCLNFEQGASVL